MNLKKTVAVQPRQSIVGAIPRRSGKTPEILDNHLMRKKFRKFRNHKFAPRTNLLFAPDAVDLVPELPGDDRLRIAEPGIRKPLRLGQINLPALRRFQILPHIRNQTQIERFVEIHHTREQFRIRTIPDPTEVLQRELDADPQLLRKIHNEADVRKILFAVLPRSIRHDVEKRDTEPDPDEVSAVAGKFRHPEAERLQYFCFFSAFGIPEKTEIEPDRKKRGTIRLLKITGRPLTGTDKFHHQTIPFLFHAL